jgi:hypothetical protein
MLLAELNVRHTRRHMPTRRVALGECHLPMTGPGHGLVLLGAVVAEFAPQLDEEHRALIPPLVREALDGLAVPRIAARYRLQTDTHGLDRSRHRIVAEPGRVVLELDAHGRAAPQVIGAVMAVATLGPSARGRAAQLLLGALGRPSLPEGLEVRRLVEGVPGLAPFAPGAVVPGTEPEPGASWLGIPSDRRWAMEVLGVGPQTAIRRADVHARFRRLVRLAHPDHGAAAAGAAERLAELTEARQLLVAFLAAHQEHSGS